MNKALVVLIPTFFLAACGPAMDATERERQAHLANSDKNAKLQALLEQQRSTALNNASSNASVYFASNPRFDSSWKIVPHTDDVIGPACPQGSGWAWISVMKVEGKNVEKHRIWCSTSSQSVGCYIENDFLKGPHAKEANVCDANLPHPLKAFK